MFKVDFDFATTFTNSLPVHALCEDALKAIWGNTKIPSWGPGGPAVLWPRAPVRAEFRPGG